jgi:CheY-like chemotaxis protein
VPTVVALCEDLMFLSRIREAARVAGVEVLSVRDAAGLVGAANAGAQLALVDLDGRLPVLAAVEGLRQEPRLRDFPVVGFVSHVDVDRAEAARAAGCSSVLSRGAFVRQLPGLLGQREVS